MAHTNKKTSPHRTAARLFGLFFILAFLSYGIGAGMIGTITGTPDFLANVIAEKTTFVGAIVLIAVVHTLANIGLPVLMLPVLSPINKRLAYGYLSFAVTATVIIAAGTVFMLLLIPLAEAYLLDGTGAPHFMTLANLFNLASSYYSYHLGMALWAIGGLLFCAVLYQSKLLPKFMPLWGMFGYVVLTVGSVLELFGHNDLVEIISVVPGGLFEVTLSLWLIFKGFTPVVSQAE